MEAVIFIGVQASGKSTFFARQFADSHIRISLDMLKTRHRESLLLRACLEMKQSFVVDNTNPTPPDRARYIESAKASHFGVIGFYFQSKSSDLLLRNSARPEGKRVPERGILGTHGRLVLPTLGEGFDKLYYVRIAENLNFIVDEWRDEV